MGAFSLLIIAAVVLTVCVIAIILVKAKSRTDEPPAGAVASYELQKTLFTPGERSFAGVLDGALPDDVTWFAKVRLGDVFKTRKGLSPSHRASAANKIDRKHVDFLLVRRSDFSPLAGVELDDRSHESADRKQRDAFVDELYRSCALPLLHVPAQAAYNQSELRAKIGTLLASQNGTRAPLRA